MAPPGAAGFDVPLSPNPSPIKGEGLKHVALSFDANGFVLLRVLREPPQALLL
jgi:hypothetical protein